VSLFNPIVYMVDTMRFGMLGSSDFPGWVGLSMLVALAAVGTAVALVMLRRGYKLKS
jgi:ABC-2 type transport system permease protein